MIKLDPGQTFDSPLIQVLREAAAHAYVKPQNVVLSFDLLGISVTVTDTERRIIRMLDWKSFDTHVDKKTLLINTIDESVNAL